MRNREAQRMRHRSRKRGSSGPGGRHHGRPNRAKALQAAKAFDDVTAAIGPLRAQVATAVAERIGEVVGREVTATDLDRATAWLRAGVRVDAPDDIAHLLRFVPAYTKLVADGIVRLRRAFAQERTRLRCELALAVRAEPELASRTLARFLDSSLVLKTLSDYPLLGTDWITFADPEAVRSEGAHGALLAHRRATA